MEYSRAHSTRTKPTVGIAVKIHPKKRGSMEDWLTLLAADLSADFQVSVSTYGPCHSSVERQLRAVGAQWHNLADVERSFRAARSWVRDYAQVAHFSLFAPRDRVVLAAQTVASPRIIFQDCYSTPLHQNEKRTVVSRVLDRFTFARVERVIGVSQFVTKRLQSRFGIGAPKCAVVYNGVDPDRFLVSRPASECIDVLCVAALIPEKGVEHAIRALAFPGLQDTRLKICGEGPDRARLEALVAELGLQDRVLFLGLRSDVETLLGDAAIAVHPAIWGEAFGLTIAEAMAAGRPVVGCKVGAVPELISDGESGFVVAAANPEELAGAFLSLLADAPLRDRMGHAGRARVTDNYSMSSWVTKHGDLLRQLIAVGGAAPKKR